MLPQMEKPLCPVQVILPGLRLSEVQVVDAVEIHVLSVPGKGRLPHAEVQVRGVDTLDGDPTLLLHQI